MKNIKLIGLAIAALFTGVIRAQEAGEFRIGVDLGYMAPKGGGGLSYYVEPKFNIKDNMNVGLKIGGNILINSIESSDPNLDGEKGNLSFGRSYIGTFDYYFNDSQSTFAPYIGGGLGLYQIANLVIDINDEELEFANGNKFGGLIRGGFEWGKFRMGIEYMIIPESKLSSLSGDYQGSIPNSSLNIHIGYFYGSRWGM